MLLSTAPHQVTCAFVSYHLTPPAVTEPFVDVPSEILGVNLSSTWAVSVIIPVVSATTENVLD